MHQVAVKEDDVGGLAKGLKCATNHQYLIELNAKERHKLAYNSYESRENIIIQL